MQIPDPDIIGIGFGLFGGGLLQIWPRKYCIGCCMIVFGLGLIAFGTKEKAPQFSLPQTPSKTVAYTDEQKNAPIIETVMVGKRVDANELIAVVKNVGNADLKREAEISLGIFDFANKKINWISAQNKEKIKAGHIARFSFKYPIQKEMFVVIGIEVNGSKNEVLLDDKHIAYTWDSWNAWGWWDQNLAYVDVKQTTIINELTDNFHGCAAQHFQDGDYSHCFSGELK